MTRLQNSHSTSRRAFIAGAAAGAAALGAGKAAALVGTPASGAECGSGALPDLATADVDTWSDQIGRAFSVETAAGAISLLLVSVAPGRAAGPHAGPGVRTRAFTVTFKAAAEVPADRTYVVRPAHGGALPIHFSPAAEPGKIVALFA
ncbi:hypothetical protein [Sphingosinicella sp. BN140058]|uniref:DUF6916 family protein n=1 Tax=Sphingosinicella sp. BN140058 TaxID=1892855 RepID=UPI0013EB8807|nr:hypothetical protein [Sphingosinicella sp. BN140058]